MVNLLMAKKKDQRVSSADVVCCMHQMIVRRVLILWLSARDGKVPGSSLTGGTVLCLRASHFVLTAYCPASQECQ